MHIVSFQCICHAPCFALAVPFWAGGGKNVLERERHVGERIWP